MVFYTLCISVFNLALGYALALYLQSRGMSPGWLRPDFFSRLKLPRFGRDSIESVASPTKPAIAIEAAPSESVAPFVHPSAAPAESSVGAAAKTGSSEPVLTCSK